MQVPKVIRQGLSLHYQWRDYAPLQSRPPCHETSNRGCKPLPQRKNLLRWAVPTLHPGETAGTEGRGVCGAKRIRSLYLPSLTGRPPELCTPLRYKAEPHSILSMARLCAVAEQTALPRDIQSRLQAAPTGPRDLPTGAPQRQGGLRQALLMEQAASPAPPLARGLKAAPPFPPP
jgi:hypothetical protein